MTIALERGLLVRSDPAADVVLDTPAGPVRARPHLRPAGSGAARPSRRPDGADAARTAGLRVERVSFANVPSFVLHGGLPVTLGARTVPVDVAFGGAFYAIVDAEAAGVPLRAECLEDLRALGMEIKRAVERAADVAHPDELRLRGIYGTIFTGPPEHEG
ncbi:MAG: proline racemase family protein, partial [Acidobacteria bacterium]|nr:proline racemase family protein [Acidobacteriota bacterium]